MSDCEQADTMTTRHMVMSRRTMILPPLGRDGSRVHDSGLDLPARRGVTRCLAAYVGRSEERHEHAIRHQEAQAEASDDEDGPEGAILGSQSISQTEPYEHNRKHCSSVTREGDDDRLSSNFS